MSAKSCVLLSALVTLVSEVAFGEAMCEAKDVTVLECQVRGGRYLALCATEMDDGKILTLNYRFGQPGKIDLIYPELLHGSLSRFNMSHYFRAGADYFTVWFSNGGYDYSVYRYEGVFKGPDVRLGVFVVNQQTKREIDIQCVRTMKDEFFRLEGRLECNRDSALGCAP